MRIYDTGLFVSTAGRRTVLDRAAALGFDTVALRPLPGDQGGDALAAACAEARSRGLGVLLDLELSRVPRDGTVAGLFPSALRPDDGRVDPRRLPGDPVPLQDYSATGLVPFLTSLVARHVEAGVTGFRCRWAQDVPPFIWQAVIDAARNDRRAVAFLAWGPGVAAGEASALARLGFDWLTTSVAWWDGKSEWLARENRTLAAGALLLGFPEDPDGPRLAGRLDERTRLAGYRRAIGAAAATGDGWLMPMGFELALDIPLRRLASSAFDFNLLPEPVPALCEAIVDANTMIASRSGRPASLETLAVTDQVTVLLAGAGTSGARAIFVNPSLDVTAAAPWSSLPVTVRPHLFPNDERDADMALAPGEVRTLAVDSPPTGDITIASPFEVADAAKSPRIAIEGVVPCVDEGRFAVKRLAGDVLEVEADIFADGHEVLAAELLYRAADEETWQAVPFRFLVNDRWRAEAILTRVGRYEVTVEAWWDVYGTFHRDLGKKVAAGLDLSLEAREGRILIETARDAADGDLARRLHDVLEVLDRQSHDQVPVLLAPETLGLMAEADRRPFRTRLDRPVPVEVDRKAAGFASWYELFPRSITDSAHRHGTFDDVIGRLPAIRAMGFDVLYFPPIHPIGMKNRKGRNNTLTPAPDDPGSPYAIGSAEGGHDAVHPELGGIEAFRRLVAAAKQHELEIALDFAIQCSPDHPWLAEHPGWFDWRPDGTIKYAENPPKKYQDIVNVDFYARDAVPDLWLALRDVVQYWVDEGVLTFRVDNPHTKPFPFWEWLIADIRSRNPNVLFLAEAFTRPKVMYRLGKVGFSQSYTYFTWRNVKWEITEYLEELNRSPARDVYRPHFFVNTPDINPTFLQTSGRPGFLIRAALAGTLSGLLGVYSGFELCEGTPLSPGKEEYLDSEKYEIRPRDYLAPGNIVAELTKLNAIRRAHPALQTHLNVSFLPATNENVIFFSKGDPAREELILVMINLDPHNAHNADIELPLWRLGLSDDATVEIEDQMSGARFAMSGKWQHVRLDPNDYTFAIWRILTRGA